VHSPPRLSCPKDDGMPVVCALNFDHVSLAQRDRIGAPLCTLPESRRSEVRRGLLVACGFGAKELANSRLQEG